ncbi:hypothetical protein L7F22_022087 [Adiantum nelumboides]|nr:hypothetical protein [Adiantum nelumboides]
MATEGGVLGVIRAARPQFCSVHDRVAFAVHAVFQSAGYSLIAVGSRVPPDLPEDGFGLLKGDMTYKDDSSDDEEQVVFIHSSKKNKNEKVFSREQSKLRDIKDDRIEGDARQSSILVDESAPSMRGLRYPPVPGYGSSDLLPGAGVGVFPSSVDPGVGGMLVGPHDPRWGSMGYGEMPILPDGDRGILPPGARYDPVGPPGVPGFEPGRFRRGRHSPGRVPNPDLEHFSPF